MKTYAGTSDILKKIYFEIDQLSQNPKNIKDYSKFHKDGKVHIKIIVPLTRKVSSRNFKLVKDMSKNTFYIYVHNYYKGKMILTDSLLLIGHSN